ncbi:hypothetical protein [Massilia sp. ST3]|uniref:hypothetical protein n=1 Tax=Massilia sp. ST3 TaxID=2824903 RepID=UPI001B82A1A4|nr:hypothetical protein [Massilia sp. ST3]MBQ5948431.1 hypothetical protein [Massilia sp. ST3]
MTHRLLPCLILAQALLASGPARANDWLNNLAKQAANTAIQQTARQLGAPRAAPPAAPAPVAAAAGAIPVYPAPAIVPRATRITFDDGVVFHGDYLADYWSRPDPVTRGTTPDRDAPGHVIGKPTSFGGSRKYPGTADLQRKLEAIFPRVLAHPALANIRGASLRPGGSFGHERGGPMGHALAGRATLLAYPIRLDDPDTRQFPDGSYHSPGEGAVMRIVVNDTDELERRAPLGAWNGMTVLRDGYMFVIPNTERPLYVRDASGGLVLNPNLIDTTRPRSDIQFMTVYVGTTSSEHNEVVRQRLHPTSEFGRLVGVLYNTDWRTLLREVNDPR